MCCCQSNLAGSSFYACLLDKKRNEPSGVHIGLTFFRCCSVSCNLQLPIADREYDPIYARLSLSMFGKTVDSWNFDESTLNEIKGHGECVRETLS